MNEKENLFYALGHLAYAVAMADGEVQKEERQLVHQIVSSEMKKITPEINISEIIFSILSEQQENLETTLSRGLKELRMSKNSLDSKYKDQILQTLYKVAEAFPPVEQAEQKVLSKIKQELDLL